MYRVYTKEKISKEIFNVNLNEDELQTVMGGNVFLDHSELNKDDYIVVQKKEPFEFATFREETNTIEEMTKYEKFKNNLYELQYNEVEYNNDILTLETGQYIENNELITVEKLEGTRVEWNWETHVWEEKASDLEIVEAQYKDYSVMDTPSTVQEMKLQDEGLAEEFLTLLIDLRGIIYTLKVQETEMFTARVVVPEPSTALKNFRNKFKLTK